MTCVYNSFFIIRSNKLSTSSRFSSSALKTMAPRYKLTYFDLRGRAEPTRIALAYAGVDYDDVRVSFENRFEGEWSEMKNSK